MADESLTNSSNTPDQPEAYENVKTDIAYNRRNDPKLDPFEINFREEYASGRGPREPFVNRHGVLIGDHEYESPQSPLEHWSKQTDPSVMSGDEWVHPYKDVGFLTEENRELFEQGIAPQGAPFQHADKNTAYDVFQSGEARETARESDGKKSLK
ncbi:Protein of unknown function [Paenibacillus sp. UNCCL117]|uniref:DUF3905 domain-containing protein n=1 Tax=unclassified Paenibacillus TaxID=185978 RepID=UPI000884853B|nr:MULTISPECIES: DUF3905 domain-containing protein [unclassified Paenibacillus]SDD80248.1 Protein of unknown function [Paenibacillus sp. cl123]SFW53381.1 Protein of unknown function [Paenibacillus sp. UNCCL117]